MHVTIFQTNCYLRCSPWKCLLCKDCFPFLCFFFSFFHSCRVGPRFISVGKLRLSWKSWSSTSPRVERSSAQNHLVRWPQKKKSPSLYQRVNVLLFPVNCDLADPFSPLCYCWHRVAGREREELSRTFPEFREAEGYAYKSQRHSRRKMARGPHSSTRATGRYIYSSSRLNQTRKRAPTSA